MKSFLQILFSFLLITQICFAQWVDLSANIPEKYNLKDVYFVGEKGWICGADAKLLYTTDVGQSFSYQNLPTNAGMTNSIAMRSSTEGYVVQPDLSIIPLMPVLETGRKL